jgi:YidC/Oxa1 family membrane protein insertase
MNKPGSLNDFFRNLLLAGAIFFAVQLFLGRNNSSNQTQPRKAPALAQAFAGIDPGVAGQTAPLDATTAKAEIVRLQGQIKANDADEVARWSQLRIGLIEQYVLGGLTVRQERVGISGFFGILTPQNSYEDIIRSRTGDAIEAQALYQQGDLLWRQSLQKPELASSAVAVFDSFIEQGRGSALSSHRGEAFRALQIFVPKIQDPAQVPLKGIPTGGFRALKVSDLQGTLQNPNPQGIVDRAYAYYSQTTLYKIFDTMVRALGSNPTYSYGFAFLMFAVFLRSALQPIYKKQYESMKGMAAIAPEMKKIQERYKGKTEQNAQMAQMKEIQELQRRHGVNPMLGCALGIIQMPIFFMFVSPMIRHYEPKMDLVGASFFWIHSLALPDIALLVLYGISMFLSFRLTSTPPADDAQRQQQMMMSYGMPPILTLFVASFPAAFVMYWTAYNVLGTFYQWRMMKAADPSKNLLKTLIGDGFTSQNPTADAVPARPAELNGTGAKPVKSVKIQTKTPPASLNGKVNGDNGTANGHGKNGSNGVHQSAPDGTVLEPSADEVARRKKKKK